MEMPYQEIPTLIGLKEAFPIKNVTRGIPKKIIKQLKMFFLIKLNPVNLTK